MNFRENKEAWEREYLSPYASLSAASKGRDLPETPCSLRTCFQRDRDRVLHSKAFRRLKHKTQVYISPEGDHYRTRLTHTLEVSQIARTIAGALRLNEDLVECIALAHDLGHTPFGHIGEEALNDLNPKGFQHYRQSIRVVEFLEGNEKRQGLNLSAEVKDGIVNHTGSRIASTLEGRLIKFSDRIAYINHDIDDSIRAGILTPEELPSQLTQVLGRTHGDRIDRMVKDLVDSSVDQPDLKMSPEVYEATMELRKFMFARVYNDSDVKREAEKAKYLIEEVYRYYLTDLSRLPTDHLDIYALDANRWQSTDHDIVSDYIAGMTDKYLLMKFEEIFIPKSWMG